MRVADAMRDKLAAAFVPSVLEIEDESAQHAGHMGHDHGGRSETHFHVRLVSEAFAGLGRLERQRRVHAVLRDELAGPVHALSLTLLAPSEDC